MFTFIVAALLGIVAVIVGIGLLVVWSVGVDASRAKGNWER